MDMKSLEEKRAAIEQRFNAQNGKIDQIKSQLNMETEELILIRGEYRAINELLQSLLEEAGSNDGIKNDKKGK